MCSVAALLLLSLCCFFSLHNALGGSSFQVHHVLAMVARRGAHFFREPCVFHRRGAPRCRSIVQVGFGLYRYAHHQVEIVHR